MKKLNYAQILSKSCEKKNWIEIIQDLPREDTIHMQSKPSTIEIPSPAVILDFEGNPVFMIGLMIKNFLFSFYIKDHDYRTGLYCFLLRVLSTLHDAIYFTFSSHEQDELQKIVQYLAYQGKDLSTYIMFEKIPIINMQLSKFESVLEALYSCHPQIKITGDALFRNTKMVDQLFYAKKYDEVVNHNQNCLENESIILNRRWLKLYTV